MDANKIRCLVSRLTLVLAAAATAVVFGLAPLVAKAVEDSKAHAAAIDGELARVAKMPRAEQQAWLRRLESRYGRAVGLAMNAEQAAELQKQVQAKVHQKTISWRLLRELIEATNDAEKKAVDQLVGRFHRKLADVFASDETATPWREAWTELYEDWKGAERAFHQQDGLVDWLQIAIARLDGKPTGEIPQRPLTLPHRMKANEGSDERVAQKVAAASSKASSTPVMSSVDAKKTAESQAARPATEKTLTKSPAAIRQPMAVPGKELPGTETARGANQTSPTQAASAKPTASATKSAVPRVAAKQPIAPEAFDGPAASPEPPLVHIDVEELAARIAGCNLEFRGLESELDEKGLWNAARLEPIVERLKILLLRRHDLRLFRESLTEEKRASTAKLESPKVAVAQVAAKIVEIRRQVSESASRSEADRRAELERLDMLSRRLAEMHSRQ